MAAEGDAVSDTLFLQDTLNTARALAETLAQVAGQVDEAAAALVAGGARRLVALGNGSSLCAAVASVYLHNALAAPGSTLAWAVPTGDYALYPAPLSGADALVGVSASGEVVDLLDLFEPLRGRHQLVGVTNVAGSSLTRLVDHVLLTQAGAALVPTSTKTFVTTVAALDLLWLGLLEAQGCEKARRLRAELEGMPEVVGRALAQAQAQVAPAADRLAHCARFFIFGAGPSFGVALEAALVFKEVAGLPAEAAQTREMAQGTIAVVDGTVGAIAVSPPGRGAAAARQVLAQLAALGAATLEVGPGSADMHFEPSCSDLLSPLTYSLPLFLLANELAGRRGVDTDHPAWEQDYLREVRRPGRPRQVQGA